MKNTATKKRSTSTGMTVRGGREITTTQARAVLAKKGKGGGKRGASKASSEKQLMNFAIGAAIVGAAAATLEKPGGIFSPEKLKDIPGGDTLGAEGVMAVAAHFIGKGKPGTLTNVRNSAVAIAVANMVKTKMAHA